MFDILEHCFNVIFKTNTVLIISFVTPTLSLLVPFSSFHFPEFSLMPASKWLNNLVTVTKQQSDYSNYQTKINFFKYIKNYGWLYWPEDLNKDPSVWLVEARPANTCNTLFFLEMSLCSCEVNQHIKVCLWVYENGCWEVNVLLIWPQLCQRDQMFTQICLGAYENGCLTLQKEFGYYGCKFVKEI
jgi:hypothetical protein